MSSELSKTYDPSAVEAEAYRVWLDEECFKGDPDAPGDPFTIVIPPPNVTGALHLGHAINNTLQDLLCRYHRMLGHNVLWVPGVDHAGIATQAVVERKLKEEENKTRHDVGREALVERIWAWKQQYGDRIIEQLKLLGASCDWSRQRFTLDDMCARAVREIFFKLFKDGLIFRGKRLVNWDIHLQTSISNDEIYHEKVKTNLWHMRYPIDGTDKHMIVATTRPETMLGDTAVAVHPDDPRWNWAIGKQVKLPLTGRLIPIVGDNILVSMEFGSGCVKVTPAHDPNDYACWERHKSEVDIINILNPDGTINREGGAYEGMPRYDARKKVVKDLDAAGLLEKEEPYETEIGHSDRSKTPIEPMLSDQWFVHMAPLAEPAIQAVRQGVIKFFPERHGQQYLNWLGEKRDWPISRQLWWGHRIPIWTIELPLNGQPMDQVLEAKLGGTWEAFSAGGGPAHLFSEPHPDERDIARHYVCLRDERSPLQQKLEDMGFVQDPDVLDTWFSSALWPHSTLGWPEDNAYLKRYYPTSVLLTGRDIITLWVARMVMTGIYNMADAALSETDADSRKQNVLKAGAVSSAASALKEEPHTAPAAPAREAAARKLGIPFHHVAINPTILDGKGERMSKSKGNGVDPVDIIHTHGADAMRFTLTTMATETQDVRMPVKQTPEGRNTSDKFDAGRNFANKLWNAARFVLMSIDGVEAVDVSAADLSAADKWMLTRLFDALNDAEGNLATYRFDQYARAAYDFFWRDFCDWYVESAKPAMKDPARQKAAASVLASGLDASLRMLHPMVPFITETIWWRLSEQRPTRGIGGVLDCPESKRLVKATWPAVQQTFADDAALYGRMQEIVTAVRNLRNEHKVEPKRSVDLSIVSGDGADELRRLREIVELLANVKLLDEANDSGAKLNAGGLELRLIGLVDEAAEEQRIAKRRDELTKAVKNLKGRLSNASYVDKAPAHLVEQTRQQLKDAEAELAALG